MGPGSVLGTLGGASALLAAATLLIGFGGLTTRASALRPWLAVLFGINAGIGDVSHDSLRVINAIDVALLLLACVTFIGVWPGPGGSYVAWMALAVALPIAGIPILLATRLVGRSGFMGGGAVVSVLMLFNAAWLALGSLGLVANLLLLLGDFATGERRSPITAVLVAIGYLAMIGWLFWIGIRMLT
jgi:hypothetical protein